MKGSLRDQLLKAGLVDQKRVNKAEAEKKRQGKKARKARKSGQEQAPSASQLAAEKARQEQDLWAQRSRDLNRAREEKRARKALQAEVAKLIESHSVTHGEGDQRYHFSHNKKIKRIYVSKKQSAALTQGELAVVCWQGKYHLLPAANAEKVQQKLPDTFVFIAEPEVLDPDDPYADFPIPDDLDW